MNNLVEEILDLVDENDHVIGQKPRSAIYAEGLKNFRVVNAFVVNSEGKLWIPRRSAHKKLFPLGLDMSMGGHVESGESYDVAFGRELKEELGLDAQHISYALLGHLSPYQDNVSAFMNVYEIKINDVPDYEKKDFTEYFWLTPQEVLNRLAHGEKAKDDLPRLIRIFYSENSSEK